MKLKGIGETFQEAHPIMNVFGDLKLVTPAVLLLIVVACIVYKTSKDGKYINFACALIFIGVIAVIAISVGALMKLTYIPTYIYEGEAKVQSVSPVDDDMNQKITLKNQDGARIIELSKKQIDGLEKNDKVTMTYTYKYDGNFMDIMGKEAKDTKDLKDTSIYKKTHNPKRHINFEKIKDLDGNIELKKKD